MKVLLVYNNYNGSSNQIASCVMKLKGSFEAAFENSPEHTYEVLKFGFVPGVIRDNDELNAEILKRDFDVCMVAEEMHFHIKLETAKKLGNITNHNILSTFHLFNP